MSSEIEISIASNPNKVVNLIIGLRATEEVSLKDLQLYHLQLLQHEVQFLFLLISTSTTFLALSHAPPAFAINTAWKRPNTAIEIKKLIKKETGSVLVPDGAERNAKARQKRK